MKKSLLTLLLLSLTGLTHAQSQHTHPLDVKRADYHGTDTNQSTYGMIHCEQILTEDWDKELNKYYKELMSVLDSLEQTKLKASQRTWIKYRDSELDFSDVMHHNMDGSMWRVAAAVRRTDLIRQRALELKTYYDTKMEEE